MPKPLRQNGSWVLSGPAGSVEVALEPLTVLWERDGKVLLRLPEPGIFRTAGGMGHPTHARAVTGDDGHLRIIFMTSDPRVTLALLIEAQPDGFGVRWLAAGPVLELVDRFDLASGGHWYGQGELLHQVWPLEQVSLPYAPLRTWDNGPTGLGDIQEPLWIASAGAGIYAPKITDPFVGINAPYPPAPIPAWELGEAQLPFDRRPPRAQPGTGDGRLALGVAGTELAYQVLLAAHAPGVVWAFMLRAGHPPRVPHERLLREPIWTTWARYKNEISQAKVLEFAAAIRSHGYPGGTLEIDAQWQAEIGDWDFAPARFPDPPAMVAKLHDLGFAVTLWTVPFFAQKSLSFGLAAERGYLARQRGGGEPYLARWRGGRAALLDLTQLEALEWYGDQLAQLQSRIGLDGFKFDAGEACFMPPDAVTANAVAPNELSQGYVAYLTNRFPYSEVRTGWHNQTSVALFRQWDKSCTWGADNGLLSTLTQGLTLSIMGYPFVLPDMVGGNGYAGQEATGELMVRWTQANLLFPGIQLSLAPWDYGAECDQLCKTWLLRRADFVDEILGLARAATGTGAPILRPLWWAAPHDPEAALVADQLLLGDDWLVAPVVVPGAVARDVYLPPGLWQAWYNGTHEAYEGGRWLRNYPAPLERLPLFRRMTGSHDQR